MAVPKAFILLGLLGVALLFCIIGLAIPRWSVASVGKYEAYFGLWKSCSASPSYTTCISSSDASPRLMSIRAMEILGMLFTLGALVSVAVRKFVMKDSMILHKAIGGLALTAGLMMLIGCIIYTTYNLKAYNLSAGFALCIVAGIMALVGGVLQFAIKEEELA